MIDDELRSAGVAQGFASLLNLTTLASRFERRGTLGTPLGGMR
jgi:hypothetical protein